MKLYHFCSRHHLPGIQKEGITRGCIPLSYDPPELASGYQWLTSNKSFNQSWCEFSSLPYDRTDFRITLKIPKKYKKNLFPWIQLSKALEIYKPKIKKLREFGDPENWFVYVGNVPPGWFRKINRNPAYKPANVLTVSI